MVIPEDPVLDQYVLKPIVERLFEDLGRRATVPLLAELAPRMALGGGRARAMEPLGQKEWRSLLGLCPELDALRNRLLARLCLP